MLFGRMLSARDSGAAVKGGLMAVAGLAVTAAIIVALGIACRALVPVGTPPEQVLSAALLAHLPSCGALGPRVSQKCRVPRLPGCPKGILPRYVNKKGALF